MGAGRGLGLLRDTGEARAIRPVYQALCALDTRAGGDVAGFRYVAAPTQIWPTFLRNHAHHLWAADLLSVPYADVKTLHVLVFIAHGRRELVHVNVTANPTAAWVWRQLIEATPWGQKTRHLLPVTALEDFVFAHEQFTWER